MAASRRPRQFAAVEPSFEGTVGYFDQAVDKTAPQDESTAAGLRYRVTSIQDWCIDLQWDADTQSWPARFNAATQ